MNYPALFFKAIVGLISLGIIVTVILKLKGK